MSTEPVCPDTAAPAVELSDEALEDVVAAFEAAEMGVACSVSDEKRQIVTWLAESGFGDAAAALTEWTGPYRSAASRLREAHSLVDWLANYQLLPMPMTMTVNGQGVAAVLCTRHGEGDRAMNMVLVPGSRGLQQATVTLDALFDAAAAHEIGEHGDRD